MEVKGLAAVDLGEVVTTVSAARYGGNIVLKSSRNRHNSKGLRSSFTLRAVDSRGAGAGRSWRGRRQPTACWHAHWHVLDALFRRWPAAEVRTMYATYTASTFHERAGATAFLNRGSLLEPARASEMCDCVDDEWVNPEPITAERRPVNPWHGQAFQPQPEADRLEYLAQLDMQVQPEMAERPEPLEDRMAREIAEAEATMTAWSNPYSWSPDTPHLYEEGLRDGKY